LRIALHEAYNCPEQTLGVDIVCLDVLGAAIDRETRCIEDVVLDAVVAERVNDFETPFVMRLASKRV
jgi:hypothetical protein